MQDAWLGPSSNVLPIQDSDQNQKDTIIRKIDKTYYFITHRALNTGDTEQDSIIKCGAREDFKWIAQSGTAQLEKYNKIGSWYLDLDS